MAGKIEGERLGDILIRKGMITPEQLDQAVQCQVLFGGRLGTNLLELGHLREKELTEVLAQKCQVPAVKREELENIPAKLIDLISKELAGRYEAVPVRLEGHQLHFALLDPDEVGLVKVLASATGKVVRPMLTLEVHLRWALDRYYGIKREARFINLDRNLAQFRQKIAESTSHRPAAALPQKPLGPGDSFWAGSQAMPLIPLEPLLPDPQDITAMEGAPRSLDDFWERVGRTSHPHHLLPRVFRQLQAAKNRDQIAQIVLDFVMRILPRVALFFIKEGMVFGWDARGEKLSRELIGGIMIPLDRPSIFRTVVETGAPFLGPVPDVPFNRRFLTAIGGIQPAAVILTPVSLAGRVVAILYADMGRSQVEPPDLTDLQAVLAEAQKAFGSLIAQSKAGT